MKQKYSAVLAALAVTLPLAAAARADIKIVSETTIKGVPSQAKTQMPDLDKPRTVTTYYKGSKQRIEDGKNVTITDFDTGKVYSLDVAKKTYSETDLNAASADMAGIPLTTTLVSATVNEGKDTKTIAGKEAKSYKYLAVLQMGMENGDASLAAMMPTISIQGEQWTTEAVTLPVTYTKIAQTTFVKRMPPMMAGGLKGFVEKMATIKGTPLSSTTSMSFTLPAAAKDSPMAQMMPKEPMVTTNEVKSISEESLPDTLFAPPADFKKVDANAPSATPASGQ